ncbi:MAG: biopolymer transporter ExbD [Candidatus Krumholzibacteriia bacterium]|nr:biopolymer transporter ExbD [bacterium]MCB9514123.1 biopolymer transporter ExbD [Candidatus Latescibacterota bacterium]MCB9515656.1 biopolymer transporter ExbD [Candidatus Latescibacterota bacterium]
MLRSKRGQGRGFRQLVAEELEILPLLNLFIALIPMLLISAVFLQVTVIDMHLPPADSAPAPPAAPGLDLSVSLEDGAWRVEGRGIAASTIAEDADGPARLGALLAAISREHPDERDIVIVSTPHTRYARIVAAMDIARGSGWPDVALYGDASGGKP